MVYYTIDNSNIYLKLIVIESLIYRDFVIYPKMKNKQEKCVQDVDLIPVFPGLYNLSGICETIWQGRYYWNTIVLLTLILEKEL